MTEGRKNIQYLSVESVEIIYEILYELAHHQGEPIPVFNVGLADKGQLENILRNPQVKHFGFEPYKTLAEKASI